MAYPSEYVKLCESLVSVSRLNFVICLSPLYRIMPTASGEKDKEVATRASQSPVVPNEGAAAAMPLPLPVQVIERNRLTLAEILTLPKFRDYRSGEPSKVRSNLNQRFIACRGEVHALYYQVIYCQPVKSVFVFEGEWRVCITTGALLEEPSP